MQMAADSPASRPPRHLLGNDLVREARKRAGLTQQELAERAGTTQSAIARLETGKTSPSFEHVVALIRLCDLDLEVALVEMDSEDMWQAQPLRHLTPAARVERHDRVARQLVEFRRAGKGSKDGVA